MKNTFFLLLISLFLAFSTEAQKKKMSPAKPVSVPENVVTSFKSQFAVISDNQWEKNYSGNYIATFINADKLKQTAEYSESGAIIKSKIMYLPNALPENVSTSLTTQYANAKVIECTKLQMPGVAPYYKVKIMNPDNTSKELLISEEGTVSE